jgi:hypothetical protein
MSNDTQNKVYVVVLGGPEGVVELAGIWTDEQSAHAQADHLRVLVATSGLHSFDKVGVLEGPVNQPTHRDIRFDAYTPDSISGRFTWDDGEQ